MQWQILLVLFGTPTRITLVHEVLATLRAGLLTGGAVGPYSHAPPCRRTGMVARSRGH